MKVSTVIPYFGDGASIGRAVESVWKQTLRPEEIIIVNDGSPEKADAVLRSLVEAYPPGILRICHLGANQGPGRARNIGWSYARGEYVALLDADDIWHPQKIELQLRWFRQHPETHLLCGGTSLVDPSSQVDYSTMDLRFFKLRPIDLLIHNPISTRTVMLRRDIGLRFAEHKRNSEDYQLYLTAVLKGYNLYYCDAKLAYCFKAEFGEGGLSARLEAAHRGHVDTLQQVYRQGLISHLMYLALRLFAQLKHFRRGLFVRLGLNRQDEPMGIGLKRYIPFFRFK